MSKFTFTLRLTPVNVSQESLWTKQRTILVNELLTVGGTLAKPSKKSRATSCRHCRFLKIIELNSELRIIRPRVCTPVNVETKLPSRMRTKSKKEAASKSDIDRADESHILSLRDYLDGEFILRSPSESWIGALEILKSPHSQSKEEDCIGVD